MPKRVVMIILTLIVLAATVYFLLSNRPPSTNTLVINGFRYQVEIAATALQKAKGLSNRESLCSNCGMLFIFSNDATQQFWMKDTLIPLDMIWINSQGKVVSIQTAQPEPGVSLTQLKIYKNETPAKYVLELNANDSQKIALKVGDTIDLSSIHE